MGKDANKKPNANEGMEEDINGGAGQGMSISCRFIFNVKNCICGEQTINFLVSGNCSETVKQFYRAPQQVDYCTFSELYIMF